MGEKCWATNLSYHGTALEEHCSRRRTASEGYAFLLQFRFILLKVLIKNFFYQAARSSLIKVIQL